MTITLLLNIKIKIKRKKEKLTRNQLLTYLLFYKTNTLITFSSNKKRLLMSNMILSKYCNRREKIKREGILLIIKKLVKRIV
jgi:hypothetical protein